MNRTKRVGWIILWLCVAATFIALINPVPLMPDAQSVIVIAIVFVSLVGSLLMIVG